MDIAGKVWSLLGKRDKLIHVFLAASFVALSIRSVGQQNEIEALQSEKDALQATNKAMKKAMWDWKQQLFREAAENAAAPVPLSTLQAIYGDSPSVQQQEQPDNGSSNKLPPATVSPIYNEKPPPRTQNQNLLFEVNSLRS